MPPPIRIAVIMAGGPANASGRCRERSRPKQLLRLTRPTRTLLASAVERIAPLVPRERVYIATARGLVEPIRQARTGVPDETCSASRASATRPAAWSYAAARILARYGEARAAEISMAVLTADHRIDSVNSSARRSRRRCPSPNAAPRWRPSASSPPGPKPASVTSRSPRTPQPYYLCRRTAVVTRSPAFARNRTTPPPKSSCAPAAFSEQRQFFLAARYFSGGSRPGRPGPRQATRAMAAALRRRRRGPGRPAFEDLADIRSITALMEKARAS